MTRKKTIFFRIFYPVFQKNHRWYNYETLHICSSHTEVLHIVRIWSCDQPRPFWITPGLTALPVFLRKFKGHIDETLCGCSCRGLVSHPETGRSHDKKRPSWVTPWLGAMGQFLKYKMRYNDKFFKCLSVGHQCLYFDGVGHVTQSATPSGDRPFWYVKA